MVLHLDDASMPVYSRSKMAVRSNETPRSFTEDACYPNAAALHFLKPCCCCQVCPMPFLKGDPDWPQLLRPHCPGSWGYIHGVWRDKSGRRTFLPMSSAFSAIGEGIVCKEKNCLIVRAAGRQLDLLRG